MCNSPQISVDVEFCHREVCFLSLELAVSCFPASSTTLLGILSQRKIEQWSVDKIRINSRGCSQLTESISALFFPRGRGN